MDISFFDTINYLSYGNKRQQALFRLLTENRVMEALEPFTPILAGTIPINIDVENSDADILCHWSDKNEFIAVISVFKNFDNFIIKDYAINNIATIRANFKIEGTEFEIFGQPIPVKQQAAYIHMIVEYKILQEKGNNFRQQIITLKKQGVKTEPAFAKLLGLKGNPYNELLQLYAG